MAALPMYGKNKIKKILLLWNQKADDLESFLCSIIKYSSTTKFVQMMTLGWPWPILQQGQLWFPYVFLYGKKLKQWIFSETIVVYDVKVGRYSQLNEYMKLYEYQRPRSFIDLGPNISDSIFLNFFSSITTQPIDAKFHVVPP